MPRMVVDCGCVGWQPSLGNVPTVNSALRRIAGRIGSSFKYHISTREAADVYGFCSLSSLNTCFKGAS